MWNGSNDRELNEKLNWEAKKVAYIPEIDEASVDLSFRKTVE